MRGTCLLFPLVCLFLFSSCSLFKVTLDTMDEPLPKHELNARMGVRSFYHDFSASVITVADSVSVLSDDVEVKERAIKWKIASTKKKEVTKRLFTEMQLKSFRSQMNPHFLFNALSAIQNLINKEDNEKANHYLTEFSQLMRLTLDKTDKGLVPLGDEIESIKKYLEIEKLRFHFNYNIFLDTTINKDEIEIPAMLVQPFVENAIIHGLNEKKGDKNLVVEFKINNENLVCKVIDDGVGINVTSARKNTDLNREKYGLKLAQDRINLINESYKTSAQIQITDLSEFDNKKTGTKVQIQIPLRY